MSPTQRQQMAGEADRLRQAGEFREAAELYAVLSAGEAPGARDGWRHAFCLRKLAQPLDALAICDVVLEADPRHQATLSEASRCLYAAHIRGAAAVSDQALAALARMRDLVDRLPDGRHSDFNQFPAAVLEVVRLLERSNDFEAVLGWLGELEPERLSDVAKPDRVGGFWASDRERWHVHRTKALAKLERWVELHDACQRALGANLQFRSGQEAWVRFRGARAALRLGLLEAAAEALRELAGACRHAAVFGELASAQAQLGVTESAITSYCQALLAAEDLAVAGTWIHGLATCFEAASDFPAAADHVRLAVAIRLERRWTVPQDLRESADRLGVSTVDGGPAVAMARSLRPLWEDWADEPLKLEA